MNSPKYYQPPVPTEMYKFRPKCMNSPPKCMNSPPNHSFQRVGSWETGLLNSNSIRQFSGRGSPQSATAKLSGGLCRGP